MSWFRELGVLTAVFASAAAVASPESEAARRDSSVKSHWNFGPLFEYRRAENRAAAPDCGTETFWAVRPFYSSSSSPVVDERDFLWPLGTWHEHADAAWWRALSAWGYCRQDAATEPQASSFNVFPFWFSGRDRDGEEYWGAFPFWGHHPHFLFMDDWDFAFWPIWHEHSVKGVRSHSVCWPFVTWRDAPREGLGIWPFWGEATQRDSTHHYALWPLATWAEWREDRDTSGAGDSWMFWPLFGRVNRARETQTLVLPPFFSWTDTASGTRLRAPWPLVDVETGRRRDRVSVWPFYESIDGYAYDTGAREERTRRYGWYLAEDVELATEKTETRRFTIFPFWSWESRRVRDGDGAWREVESYRRLWPFWSRTVENGRTRQRALELVPIRHSEGLDRNWAPFWTFWECSTRPDGRTHHSLFWHLITWHSE